MQPTPMMVLLFFNMLISKLNQNLLNDRLFGLKYVIYHLSIHHNLLNSNCKKF